MPLLYAQRAAELPTYGTSVLQRYLLLGTLYGLIGLFLYRVVARVRPGGVRFLLCVPILLCNTLFSPTIFSMTEDLLSRTSVIFIISWLCSFKVLALCLNRGPLTVTKTFPQFLAALLLPIIPRPESVSTSHSSRREGRLQDASASSSVLLLRWLAKGAVLGVVVYALVGTPDMPMVAKHALYALGMYAFIGVLMDAPASAAVHLIGMDIIPTFDAPWLSSSLSDWWGRRWNITTASLLRMVVYDVVCEGRLVKQPLKPGAARPRVPMWRQAAATCATFAVSGVVHEAILWGIQPDGAVGWRWTVFFSVQAPLLLLERYALMHAKQRGIELQGWLRVVLTLAALELCAAPLFFAAVELENDTAARVVRACEKSYGAILAWAWAGVQ